MKSLGIIFGFFAFCVVLIICTGSQSTETKDYNKNPKKRSPIVTEVELPDTKTVELPDAKTVELPDATTIELPDTKTIELADSKTIELADSKTIELADSKTIELPDTKKIALPDTKTIELPDTRTLDDLYALALEEGGKIVVYAGGDAPDQQESNRAGFEATFPGIHVEMIVDFSKYHDARIDYQLKNGTLVVDVAQLQTIHDFPRWKEQGALLMYKPIGWEHIYDELKDPDGAFTGVFMDAFTTSVNTELLPDSSSWPVEANDYLKPEFKNKLVVTYPNDDDAVLFWFKQVVDKYGFTYLHKFKAQNVTFVRGTATALAMVADSSLGYVATMSADGGLNSQEKYGEALPRLILPEKDPFVMWAQTAAIFKKARHPETAKLYISWLVDKKQQEQPTAWSWSVRDDVAAPDTFKSIRNYPNANHTSFLKFMRDREAVEIFRSQIALIFGEVKGLNPNEFSVPFDMNPVIGYRSNITTSNSTTGN